MATHGIVETDREIFMFMELCRKGTLFDLLYRSGPMEDSKAKQIFMQLVFAIDYLHFLDKSYQDLKCKNIFVASNDCMKIADF
jgi:serine/threonine protein kinase